ncbi:hypothetical protein D3C75_1288880 [compost metagenome]
MLMTVLPGKISCRLTAPVGLGPLAATPPQAAQEPMAITAAACSAALRICSTIGFPATML